MKTGKTLQELAAEVVRQNGKKKDYLADTPRIEVVNADNQFQLAIKKEFDAIPLTFDVNSVANRQIGTHTNIPAKYYDRLLKDHPDLLATNINTLFAREPASRMIRTMDGTARAFLSDKYRRIDIYDIANAVIPIIKDMEPDFSNSSFEITDTKMYIKIVNPRLQGEVRTGDIVQAGLMITNSEVGHGSVSVQPLVFRLVCLNGMVANIGERKYHVGRGNESGENYELYRSETLEASDRAFMMKVQDLVRTAVDETKFERVLQVMRDAADAPIIGRDIPKVVELTSREFNFTTDENEGILDYLIHGGDLSLYGLSSAVTRFSQDVTSYDRATELETAGWNVLTMPRQQWNRVNSDV
jgi:hypothetical protein